MKIKRNIPALIFAVLFFTIFAVKFFLSKGIDSNGVFYIIAVIGFLLLYFTPSFKTSK